MSKPDGFAVHPEMAAQNKPVAIGVDIGGTAIKAALRQFGWKSAREFS